MKRRKRVRPDLMVEIPQPLWQRLKALARWQGVPIQKYVVDCLWAAVRDAERAHALDIELEELAAILDEEHALSGDAISGRGEG